MIQLLFEGKCKDCDSADLVIDSYETGLGGTYHTVRCVHNNACERIAGMLKREEVEIVRCKNCKWKQGSECVRFAEVRPFPDDFCSRAERRTDEFCMS